MNDFAVGWPQARQGPLLERETALRALGSLVEAGLDPGPIALSWVALGR